jgi:uncharacterized protein HemX
MSSWVYANIGAIALAGIVGIAGYGELRAQVKTSSDKEATIAAEVKKLQSAQNNQAVAIGKIEATTKNIEKNQEAMRRSLETIANRLLTVPPR